MTQVRIFEIDEDDSDEYHEKRPKYATIVEEEEYEDEITEPIGWDFREDEFFYIE